MPFFGAVFGPHEALDLEGIDLDFVGFLEQRGEEKPTCSIYFLTLSSGLASPGILTPFSRLKSANWAAENSSLSRPGL